MPSRTWGSLIGATTVAFALTTGCTSNPHTTDEKFFLVATNIKVPYWQNAASGLNRAASEMKVKVEMTGTDTYDPQGERKELERVTALKPTGILVSAADPTILAPAIDAALAQGIPVLTVDSDAVASKRPFFVGTDNFGAGQIGGKLASKLMNGSGNVVVLTIKGQTNLDERLQGYRAAFDSHPGIKISQVVDMKGDSTAAFDAAKQMIEGKAKVDTFVCLEAIACPEVADVVNRNHLAGKMNVIAMDTDPRTLDWIQKGVITATIAQKPFTMAYYGLKLVDDLHHNKLEPLTANWAQDSFSRVPTFVDTGASLIDKNNVGSLTQKQTQ